MTSFSHFCTCFMDDSSLLNRAMAMCISLMFGRLGCVAGSNIFAMLIDNHCDLAFLLSGLSIIGKQNF